MKEKLCPNGLGLVAIPLAEAWVLQASNDTIIVGDGTYAENLIVNTANLTVRSFSDTAPNSMIALSSL